MVGLGVGLLVGSPGAGVGINKVGLADGLKVGAALAAAEGITLGTTEGERVGTADGSAVGSAVGSTEGTAAVSNSTSFDPAANERRKWQRLASNGASIFEWQKIVYHQGDWTAGLRWHVPY